MKKPGASPNRSARPNRRPIRAIPPNNNRLRLEAFHAQHAHLCASTVSRRMPSMGPHLLSMAFGNVRRRAVILADTQPIRKSRAQTRTARG